MKFIKLLFTYIAASFAILLLSHALIPTYTPVVLLLIVLFPFAYLYHLGTRKTKQNTSHTQCDEYIEFRPPVSVHIVYTNNKNENTSRTVNVTRFDGVYIAGYCNLKRGYRTFRVDRVKEVADPVTGEVKKDICKYFISLYNSSPAHKIDKALDENENLFRFIVYFVNRDFDYIDFTEDEKNIVRYTVRNIDAYRDLNDKQIDEIMSYISTTSLHSFRVIVGKIIKNNNFPNGFIDFVNEIAMADGNIDDYERETIQYIQKRIAKSVQ